MAYHNDIGRWGEQTAAKYLSKKGYTIVETDWSIGHRDIDIVAFKDELLVFVEVKTRHEGGLETPMEAVDMAKRHNLGIAAKSFCTIHRVSYPWRFDIIGITYRTLDDYDLEHRENAFTLAQTVRRRRWGWHR